MTFDRALLPDPATFYEAEGLPLTGRGRWRTARCPQHGGQSLRVNVATGAFACMGGCDFKGGDVLAYHMRAHEVDFITAAKALGAWVDDGRPPPTYKPAPLPPRQALEVLAVEANLVFIAAGNLAHGVALTDIDRARLQTAAARIQAIARGYEP